MESPTSAGVEKFGVALETGTKPQIVEPQSTDTSTTSSFSPINLSGNRIEYTKKDVDQFVTKFGKQAPTLLAKDAVMSYANTDFAEQIKKDPNFLTYEGLKNGTATILNFINDPKLEAGQISGNFSKRPNAQKAMNDTDILKFFTTLNDVDIKDTIGRELFRALPSSAAFVQTTKMVGKKLLEGGPPTSYGGAIARFGVPVITGLGTSVFTYSMMDQIDEMVLGAESVTTPGQQRALKEMLRTGTGASTGLIFPFMITKNLDWGAQAIAKNLSGNSTVPAGVKLSAGVESFLQNYSKAYTGSPLRTKGENIRFGALTAVGDAAAVSGASVGAYGAEKVDPGSTGTRLLFEIGAGSALPVLAVKASTSISNFVADKFSNFKKSGVDGLRNKAQENQMQRIVDIFKNYDKDPVAAFEALSDPNNIKTFNEVFPEADFSPTLAQESDELLFSIIEASLRKTNPDLDRYAQNSSDKMKTGLSNFLKLMGRIDDEPKEAFGALSDAAKFRRSAVEFAVGTRVKRAINNLGSSLALLNASKKRLPNGKFSEKTIIDINQKISTLLETQLKLIRKEERKLWKGINNKTVIEELDPDNKPAFMQSWESNKRPNDATDNTQNDKLSELYNFVQKYKLSMNEAPTLQVLVNQSDAKLEKIGINNIAFTNKIEDLLPNEITRLKDTSNLKNLPDQLYDDPKNKFLFNYKRAFSNTDLEYMQNNYQMGARDFFKIKILNSFLKEPDNNLTKAQANDVQNYVTLLENQQFKQLLKDEKGGATLNNADPELRFDPQYAAFLRSKGFTGEKPRPFKGITVAQLVDIRAKANELAREFGSGPNPNKQYARVAAEFASGILEDLEAYAPKASKQYRAALDYSVASHDAVTRTIVGKTKLKKPSGQKYVSPEYILNEVMSGKPSVIEQRTRQILNLSDFAVEKGFRGAEKTGMSIRQNLDEFLRVTRKELISDSKVPVIGEFTETSVPQIDQKKLDAWRDKNKELLSMFPNLDQDLSTVSNAQRLFSVWDARNTKVQKSVKNTEYLSKLIGDQHPITAIESALKGDQPTRGMLKLFRSIKGDFEGPAKKAMAEALINRAFINSGGTGGFVNAKAFYKSFYEPMPDNPSVNMMSLLKSQGIFDANQVRQIDYISKQLIKLEIADTAGNLVKNGQINEQLLGEVGPLFEFFLAISGSALGTNVGKVLTGGSPGPGSIIMASQGKNFLRNMLLKLPASEKLNLTTELFTNKQLFLNFLKQPKNEKEKLQIEKNIISILSKGAHTVGIDKAVKVTPSVIRESGEEDMAPTDETLEFLERKNKQSSVQPSIPTGTPTTQLSSSEPFLSGLNIAPAGGGATAASAPTDNSKYAALFPNDIISSMIPQQPVTMEYGGEVGSNLRQAPEVDTLRALTQKELEEASLKYLIDLEKQKNIAMDQFANPFKYLGTGYMDAGSTDAADQYRQEALAEANRLDVEMKQFGMDRAKALNNYSNYLQTDRPVTMRRSEDIQAGNVMVRNFPQELINFANGGSVQYMRNGGPPNEGSMDYGLETDLAAQQSIQGGLDPYGTGSDSSTDLQKALYNPQGFQKGRKTDYIKKILSLGLADKLQKNKKEEITGIYSTHSPSIGEKFQMDPFGTILTGIFPGAGAMQGIGNFLNPNRQRYTGYNRPKTPDIIDDGNDAYNPLIRIANQKVQQVPMRTAASLYNANPNQYTLNVSGINSLRNR